MKHRLFVLFLAAFFSFSAHNICFSQDPLKQHSFEFKGYKLELKSMATDNSGNFLFCGYIKSDMDVQQKDTMIDARLNQYDYNPNYDEQYAIVIQTDSLFEMNNVSVFAAIYPSNLLYDKENKVFWMGASHSNYLSKDEDMFGSMQLILAKIDLNKKDLRFYAIDTKFSCWMNELLLINKTLTCIGTKEKGKNEERQNTPVVIEVSDTKFHRDVNVSYFPILDILHTTISTAETANHVMLTEAVADKKGFYFVANCFPFGQIPTLAMEVYHYENGELTFQSFTPKQKTDQLPNVTNIGLTNDDNLLISYVPKATAKYFILEKLTPELNLLSTVTVPDLQYPDFMNELVILPNGKIVVAGLNAQKTWSYFVYSADGTLEKEIDTKMSKDLVIGFTKAFTDNNFVCVFRSNSKATANQLFVYPTN